MFMSLGYKCLFTREKDSDQRESIWQIHIQLH